MPGVYGSLDPEKARRSPSGDQAGEPAPAKSLNSSLRGRVASAPMSQIQSAPKATSWPFGDHLGSWHFIGHSNNTRSSDPSGLTVISQILPVSTEPGCDISTRP